MTRSEQRVKEKQTICKLVPLTANLYPAHPTYALYGGGVPLSTAAATAVVSGVGVLLTPDTRRLHERWGWEWE